jgi:hypothetical protein
MEKAPENGQESSHSAHANGTNEQGLNSKQDVKMEATERARSLSTSVPIF